MARNGGVINRCSVFEQSPLRNRWLRAVLPFLSWGGWGAKHGFVSINLCGNVHGWAGE